MNNPTHNQVKGIENQEHTFNDNHVCRDCGFSFEYIKQTRVRCTTHNQPQDNGIARDTDMPTCKHGLEHCDDCRARAYHALQNPPKLPKKADGLYLDLLAAWGSEPIDKEAVLELLTQAKEQAYKEGYKQGQFDAGMDAIHGIWSSQRL